MASLRNNLPRPNGRLFLTDGGLETSLIFMQGIDLPHFASFPLLEKEEGRRQLESYFEPYLRTTVEQKVGFILDTPTWRANQDWGRKLGYTPEALKVINQQAVTWAASLRDSFATETSPILIDGAIGPRGDGYHPSDKMTADEAQRYHTPQIEAFKQAGADLVTAFTMNYSDEAVGIARAAKEKNIPVVISFTVETDGNLASGETLQDAIEKVDAETDETPIYYMINCAHPSHFAEVVKHGGEWTKRIHGIRANASSKSHAELDRAVEIDRGDPQELGQHYRLLRDRMGHLTVLGGCCGTDHSHIVAICEACVQKQ